MMKTALPLAIMVLVFALIGYLLYLPAAYGYFYGSTLFVANVSVAVKSQLQTALIFGISAAVIFFATHRFFNHRMAFKQRLTLSLAALALNLLLLFIILLAKRNWIEHINALPPSNVPIDHFSLLLPQLLALILTCVCLFLVTIKFKKLRLPQ